MKRIISAFVLLTLLLSIAIIPQEAKAYTPNTAYAGWYQVYRTENFLSINNKPKASSYSDVTRLAGAKNGLYVYIVNAEAPGGTAKKWGRITKIYDKATKTLTKISGTAYGCMWYLKKVDDPTRVVKKPIPVELLSKTIYLNYNQGSIEGTIKENSVITIPLQTSLTLIPRLVKFYSNGYKSETSSGFEFKSSSPAVATVSSKGHIVAKRTGSTEISVYNLECRKTIRFTLKVNVPTQPVIKSISSQNRGVTLEWNNVSGIVEYQIRYGKSITYPLISRTTAVSRSQIRLRTLGLERNRTYSFQIRARYLNGNRYVYTNWSRVTKITVK